MMHSILSQFQTQGSLISIEPLSGGNINDSYLSIFQGEGGETHKYVHQRINKLVFRNPEAVMRNIRLVTSHILDKKILLPNLIADEFKKANATTLEIVKTASGLDFYQDAAGDYWRTTVYLNNLESFERAFESKIAYEMGRCLGEFHSLLQDLDSKKLEDSLPYFHHTDRYLCHLNQNLACQTFLENWEQDNDVVLLIEDIRSRARIAESYSQLNLQKLMPLRVVHNDPKCGNFLFDSNKNAVCLIDLDTVKSGFLIYDIGDCLRSAVNLAGEESLESKAIDLNIENFEAVLTGYSEAAGSFFMPCESAHFLDSLKIVTFELCIRFLASHISQDGYFKESYLGQNRKRSQIQMNLLKDIEKKSDELESVCVKLFKA